MERRIAAHLATKHASRAGMPLDDERKFWNGLVHLCLFFATLTLTLAHTLILTLTSSPHASPLASPPRCPPG